MILKPELTGHIQHYKCTISVLPTNMDMNLVIQFNLQFWKKIIALILEMNLMKDAYYYSWLIQMINLILFLHLDHKWSNLH